MNELLRGFRTLLTSHLGDFLLIQGVLVFLDIASRLVSFRRQLDSPSAAKKREGWLNVVSYGTDFCLVALAGLFLLPKIGTRSASNEQLYLFCMAFIVLLTLVAAFLMGSSNRRPARVWWDRDFLLGAHVPNALGFVAVSLVAILVAAKL